MTLATQLIPMMQAQGAWSDLLDVPLQESIPGPAKESRFESPEQAALELTGQSSLDSTEEPVAETPELPFPEPTEQTPPMAIEKAVQTLLDKTERTRKIFHRLMAVGRLAMRVRVSPTGVKTCVASYKERNWKVEVTIQVDSSEPISRVSYRPSSGFIHLSQLKC